MELTNIEDYVPGTLAKMDLFNYWIHILREDGQVEQHPATRAKECWFTDSDPDFVAYAFEPKDSND